MVGGGCPVGFPKPTRSGRRLTLSRSLEISQRNSGPPAILQKSCAPAGSMAMAEMVWGFEALVLVGLGPPVVPFYRFFFGGGFPY